MNPTIFLIAAISVVTLTALLFISALSYQLEARRSRNVDTVRAAIKNRDGAIIAACFFSLIAVVVFVLGVVIR
jgi:uncharacterized membrane protein